MSSLIRRSVAPPKTDNQIVEDCFEVETYYTSKSSVFKKGILARGALELLDVTSDAWIRSKEGRITATNTKSEYFFCKLDLVLNKCEAIGVKTKDRLIAEDCNFERIEAFYDSKLTNVKCNFCFIENGKLEFYNNKIVKVKKVFSRFEMTLKNVKATLCVSMESISAEGSQFNWLIAINRIDLIDSGVRNVDLSIDENGKGKAVINLGATGIIKGDILIHIKTPFINFKCDFNSTYFKGEGNLASLIRTLKYRKLKNADGFLNDKPYQIRDREINPVGFQPNNKESVSLLIRGGIVQGNIYMIGCISQIILEGAHVSGRAIAI